MIVRLLDVKDQCSLQEDMLGWWITEIMLFLTSFEKPLGSMQVTSVWVLPFFQMKSLFLKSFQPCIVCGINLKLNDWQFLWFSGKKTTSGTWIKGQKNTTKIYLKNETIELSA